LDIKIITYTTMPAMCCYLMALLPQLGYQQRSGLVVIDDPQSVPDPLASKSPFLLPILLVYSIPPVTWHPVITFCPNGNTLQQILVALAARQLLMTSHLPHALNLVPCSRSVHNVILHKICIKYAEHCSPNLIHIGP